MRDLSGDPTLVENGVKLLGRLMKPAANAALRAATFGSSELGDFEMADEAIDAAVLVKKLKADVGALIEKRLAGPTDRIVIFVDDLDRIVPARAVEILEIMKLFIVGRVAFLSLRWTTPSFERGWRPALVSASTI